MKTRFPLRVALSPEWLAKRRIKRWIYWGVIAIGVLVVISQFMCIQHGKRMLEQPLGLRITMVIGGIIGAVGMMGLEFTNNRCVLGVQKMDGNYAWLVGVHQEFLDRMEAWNE